MLEWVQGTALDLDLELEVVGECSHAKVRVTKAVDKCGNDRAKIDPEIFIPVRVLDDALPTVECKVGRDGNPTAVAVVDTGIKSFYDINLTYESSDKCDTMKLETTVEVFSNQVRHLIGNFVW